MGKIVQVSQWFSGVSLPPIIKSFGPNQSATLTDAEYAALPAATLRAISVTANVADPIRTPVANASTPSDALAQAEDYTDAQIATVTSGSTSNPIDKGNWSALTAYIPLNIVTYQGVRYMAAASFTSGAAFDATHWIPLIVPDVFT